MIAPGDEDEERVDDPDAILFEEPWNRAIVADELLNQVINRSKWTDRAPETSQEQKDDRDDRPPQHPGQRRAEIVVRRLGSQKQLEHDQHEEQQRGPLDDAGEPFAAHQAVDGFDLQQISACRDVLILWFDHNRHVIYLLQ